MSMTRHITACLAGAFVVLLMFSSASAQAHLHGPASGIPHGIPDLCPVSTVTAVTTGMWSSASTWSTRAVPTADARVRIPAGMRVTYDVTSDVPIACVQIDGTLAF